MRKRPAGCPCSRHNVWAPLAAERQAVRQYHMGALEDDMANIDVKGLIILVLVFPVVVILVHQLYEDRVGSPPVLQPNCQPVRSGVSSVSRGPE